MGLFPGKLDLAGRILPIPAVQDQTPRRCCSSLGDFPSPLGKPVAKLEFGSCRQLGLVLRCGDAEGLGEAGGVWSHVDGPWSQQRAEWGSQGPVLAGKTLELKKYAYPRKKNRYSRKSLL